MLPPDTHMCREVVNRGSECFANVTHPALLLLCWPKEGGSEGGREKGSEGGRKGGVREGGEKEQR